MTKRGVILLVTDLHMHAVNSTSSSQGSTKNVMSSRRRRGYPVEIFGSSEVNEKFLCLLCHLVLRHAMQRYCGHRYCRDCVDDVTADTPCPLCEREGLEEEPQDDPQVHFRFRLQKFI